MLEGLITELLDFDAQLKRTGMESGVVTMPIDGIRYTNAKLPTSLALPIWPRLGQMLGSAGLRRVATGEGALDFAAMLANMSAVAERVGLVPLCTDLLSHTTVDRYRHRPVVPGDSGSVMDEFDEHFRGEYLHLLKVCGFAIAHNLRGPTLGSHSQGGSHSPTNEPPAPTAGSASETSPT